MRVLVSAYACEPERGSEPGVGWHWVLEIARLGHETHVLTRKNNAEVIAEAAARGAVPQNLHFHYFDLPPALRFWKRGARGVYLYNLLWQWGAARMALRLHRDMRFDLAHHLTFGSVRLPSFMGRLGVPFIFGPAGGGERAPFRLRRSFTARGQIKDALRDLSNLLVRFDPLMAATYRSADRILLRTRDNLRLVPPHARARVEYISDVGAPPIQAPAKIVTAPGPRLLYVGRFIYLKGMHLGLRAFASLLRVSPNARLTMIGSGPEEGAWKRLARELGIEHAVHWLGWRTRAEVERAYDLHDLFLFPSLHDSGGSVVLEAAAHGLPIVCLKLGGPGELVNEQNGVAVEVEGRSEAQVAAALYEALRRLASADRLRALSLSARQWAGDTSWSSLVRRVYPPADSHHKDGALATADKSRPGDSAGGR